MQLLAPDTSRRPSILTSLALDRLLQWLDQGVDSHGERYLEIHRRLVSYFDRHQRLTAEALADETLGRIAMSLEEGRTPAPRHPALHCYTIARSVLHEDSRRRARAMAPVAAARTSMASGSGDDLADGSANALDRGLHELRPAERELVVEYYRDARGQGTGHRARLAKRLGLSEEDLRARAANLRQRLMSGALREGDLCHS